MKLIMGSYEKECQALSEVTTNYLWIIPVVLGALLIIGICVWWCLREKKEDEDESSDEEVNVEDDIDLDKLPFEFYPKEFTR